MHSELELNIRTTFNLNTLLVFYVDDVIAQGHDDNHGNDGDDGYNGDGGIDCYVGDGGDDGEGAVVAVKQLREQSWH